MRRVNWEDSFEHEHLESVKIKPVELFILFNSLEKPRLYIFRKRDIKKLLGLTAKLIDFKWKLCDQKKTRKCHVKKKKNM